MTWGAVAIGGASLAVGGYGAYQAGEAADEQADAIRRSGAQSEALNAERYADYQRYLNPYMERELQASNQLMYEMGMSPYMGDPGFSDRYDERLVGSGTTADRASPAQIANIKDLEAKIASDTTGSLKWGDQGRMSTAKAQMHLDELKAAAGIQPGSRDYMAVRNIGPTTGAPSYQSTPAYMRLREEGIDAVNQGAANVGTLYSGRRGEALSEVGAGVENQFYSNYMNMLQNLASPTTTTNLGAAGMNQGITQGQQNIGVTGTAGGYEMAGTAAQNAALADAMGGVSNIYAGYMGSQRPETFVGGSSPYGYGTTPTGGYMGDVVVPQESYV